MSSNLLVEERSKEEEVQEIKEEDVCRVCHCEASDENPLYHPCKCSGSIKYVHSTCLLKWLEISGKSNETCELCGEKYLFKSVYSTGTTTPPPLSVKDVVGSLSELLATIVPLIGYVAFVLSILAASIMLSKLYYFVFMTFVWRMPFNAVFPQLWISSRYLYLDSALYGFFLHCVLYIGILDIGSDAYEILVKYFVERLSCKATLRESICKLEADLNYLLYILDGPELTSGVPSDEDMSIYSHFDIEGDSEEITPDKKLRRIKAIKLSKTLPDVSRHGMLCRLTEVYVEHIESKVADIYVSVRVYEIKYSTTLPTKYYDTLRLISDGCKSLLKKQLIEMLSLNTSVSSPDSNDRHEKNSCLVDVEPLEQELATNTKCLGSNDLDHLKPEAANVKTNVEEPSTPSFFERNLAATIEANSMYSDDEGSDSHEIEDGARPTKQAIYAVNFSNSNNSSSRYNGVMGAAESGFALESQLNVDKSTWRSSCSPTDTHSDDCDDESETWKDVMGRDDDSKVSSSGVMRPRNSSSCVSVVDEAGMGMMVLAGNDADEEAKLKLGLTHKNSNHNNHNNYNNHDDNYSNGRILGTMSAPISATTISADSKAANSNLVSASPSHRNLSQWVNERRVLEDDSSFYNDYQGNAEKSKSEEEVLEGSSEIENDRDAVLEVMYVKELFGCAKYGRNDDLRIYIDLNIARLGGTSNLITDVRETEFGNTLMISAAQNGNLSTIKILLTLGFDVNAVNWSGRSAVYFSYKLGYRKLGKYLLLHGASPVDVLEFADGVEDCGVALNLSRLAIKSNNSKEANEKTKTIFEIDENHISNINGNSNCNNNSNNDDNLDETLVNDVDPVIVNGNNINTANNQAAQTDNNNLNPNPNANANANLVLDQNVPDGAGGMVDIGDQRPIIPPGVDQNYLKTMENLAKECLRFVSKVWSVFYRHSIVCFFIFIAPSIIGHLSLYTTDKLSSIREVTSFVIIDIWYFSDNFLGVFQYLSSKNGEQNLFSIEIDENLIDSFPIRSEYGILNYSVPEKLVDIYNQTRITFPISEYELYAINSMVIFFEKMTILFTGHFMILSIASIGLAIYAVMNLKYLTRYFSLLRDELAEIAKVSGEYVFVYVVEIGFYPLILGQLSIISTLPMFSMTIGDWRQAQSKHVVLSMVLTIVMGFFMRSLTNNVILSIHKSLGPQYHSTLPVATLLPLTRRFFRLLGEPFHNFVLVQYICNSLFYFLVSICIVLVMFLSPIKYGHFFLNQTSPIQLKSFAAYANVGSINLKSSISTLNFHVFMPATYSMYRSEFKDLLKFLFKLSCRIVDMTYILVREPGDNNAAANIIDANALNVNMAEENANGAAVDIQAPIAPANANHAIPDNNDDGEWEDIEDFEDLEDRIEDFTNLNNNVNNIEATDDVNNFSNVGFALKISQLLLVFAFFLYTVAIYFIHGSAYFGDVLFSLIRDDYRRDFESFQIGLFSSFAVYFFLKVIAKEAIKIPKSIMFFGTVFKWFLFLLKSLFFLTAVFSWIPVVVGLVCQWMFFFPYVTPVSLIPCCNLRQSWTFGVMGILQLASGMVVGGGPWNPNVQRQINYISSYQWLRLEFRVLFLDLYFPFALVLLDFFLIPFFIATVMASFAESQELKVQISRYAYTVFLVFSLSLVALKSVRADVVKWYTKTRDSKYLVKRELSNR